MSSLKNFVNRKKVGLILRVFANKESQILKRVAMIEKIIARALTSSLWNIPIISRIDILVWADNKYEEADCGKTTSVLRKNFPRGVFPKVFVSEVKNADLFCGILNYGIALQLRAGTDYSIIVSHEAYDYFNETTLRLILEAAQKNALAIGVAINELTEPILQGRLANTFAMWHNISLLTVGGFDLQATKPADDRQAHYMKGWHEKKGDVFYHLAGVEEVIPLARLIETFGPCLAPILPESDSSQRYHTPNPQEEFELWLRHVSKIGTKLERQNTHLASIGYDSSFLRGGVMPEYRK